MLTAGHEISGDARKLNGQFVKAVDTRVGQRNAVENEINLLPGIESGRELKSFAQAKLQLAGIFPSILFPTEREVFKRRLAIDDLVPIDTLYHVAQFSSIWSGSVNASD